MNIVGQRGNTSFSPNPVTADANQATVWNNADSVVHRIVANDGSFDTGNIAPGAASAAMAIPAAGANYHCSIHPAMVGAIRATGRRATPLHGHLLLDLVGIRRWLHQVGHSAGAAWRQRAVQVERDVHSRDAVEEHARPAKVGHVRTPAEHAHDERVGADRPRHVAATPAEDGGR